MLLLVSPQENILRQSGFEKDLEEIRTHLDCCRGGKLRILLVFLLVVLDIFLTFFSCFICCFRNVALSKLMIMTMTMKMIMTMAMIMITILRFLELHFAMVQWRFTRNYIDKK